MSAHTEGPWVVEPTSIGTIETFDGTAIAQAFQVKPMNQDQKQLERQANARLIAAAPEMLAVLKSLVTAVDNLDPQSGAPIGYSILLDVANTAAKVITKATGAA